MKKCPYCYTEIDDRAEICPACRKKVGRVGKDGVAKKPTSCCLTSIVVFFAVLFLIVTIPMISVFNEHRTPSTPNASIKYVPEVETKPPEISRTQIPEFKVIAQRELGAVCILVSPDINDDQLKALIFTFRNAKKQNTLSAFFSPTTPGGKFGDYAVLDIYVFSEPEWGNQDMVDKYETASIYNNDDIKFSEEYEKHIRAHYWYHAWSPEITEEGSLGYLGDDGKIKTEKYEQLFKIVPKLQ